MEEKKITYAGIVPLIGGMMLGAEQALGTKPEYILSYPPFESNDSILMNYWKDVPYHVIEPESNTIDVEIPKVDFVAALCPCAGLSQLNSAASRGANAPQNDWMYKTANFVLSQMRPRVFWGENAPALYGSTGKPVADELYEIGKRNGYSFSLLRTDTVLHGIPQRRPRTFYFFWDSPNAPILEWHRKEMKSLESHVSAVKNYLDENEVKTRTEELHSNPFYKFVTLKFGGNWRDVVKKHKKSLMDVIMMEGMIDEFLNFTQEIGDEGAFNRATHAKKKRDLKKNYWDFSPFLPMESTGALNGARMIAIHPVEDRYFTDREFAQMMCLPPDMEIPSESPGKIFQNVPVETAATWTEEVVKYINGELLQSDSKYLKQDNVSQTIVNADPKMSTSLF